MPVWYSMTKTVPFTLPSSRFTVAMAAMQGVYNSVKTRKLMALNGENNVCRISRSSAIPEPDMISRITDAVIDEVRE
jgi:hypothetical protein